MYTETHIIVLTPRNLVGTHAAIKLFIPECMVL